MKLARNIAFLWAFSLILVIAGDAAAPVCANQAPAGQNNTCCCKTVYGGLCCANVAYCSGFAIPGCNCKV